VKCVTSCSSFNASDFAEKRSSSIGRQANQKVIMTLFYVHSVGNQILLSNVTSHPLSIRDSWSHITATRSPRIQFASRRNATVVKGPCAGPPAAGGRFTAAWRVRSTDYGEMDDETPDDSSRSSHDVIDHVTSIRLCRVDQCRRGSVHARFDGVCCSIRPNGTHVCRSSQNGIGAIVTTQLPQPSCQQLQL